MEKKTSLSVSPACRCSSRSAFRLAAMKSRIVSTRCKLFIMGLNITFFSLCSSHSWNVLMTSAAIKVWKRLVCACLADLDFVSSQPLSRQLLLPAITVVHFSYGLSSKKQFKDHLLKSFGIIDVCKQSSLVVGDLKDLFGCWRTKHVSFDPCIINPQVLNRGAKTMHGSHDSMQLTQSRNNLLLQLRSRIQELQTFSYRAISNVMMVGWSSFTASLLNWLACMRTVSRVDHSCATSGSSGRAPTLIKGWLPHSS